MYCVFHAAASEQLESRRNGAEQLEVEDQAAIDGEEGDGIATGSGCDVDQEALSTANLDDVEIEDGKERVVDSADDFVEEAAHGASVVAERSAENV